MAASKSKGKNIGLDKKNSSLYLKQMSITDF